MNKRQAKKKRNKSIYRDTWNLDWAIAKFIHPRLVRFKEVTNCHPCLLSEQEWDDVLDKMIKAFELIITKDLWSISAEEEKQINDGLDLFRKWYFDLWW